MWMKEKCRIVVISDDGWCWLLAWMQIGYDSVDCLPTTTEATKQLNLLRENKQTTKIINQIDTLKVNTINLAKITIVCSHISSSISKDTFILKTTDFFQAMRSNPDAYVSMISIAPQSRLMNEFSTAYNKQIKWQIVRHSVVGGLTNCRVAFGLEGSIEVPETGKIKYPKRPLDRFLDLGARLFQWRSVTTQTKDCWRPGASDARPYPWPWIDGPKWVEVYTVFLKKNIERPFTEKELCQLFDLRFDWATMLPSFLSWQNGKSIPIRLFTEFILTTRQLLESKFGRKDSVLAERKRLKEQIDWGRVRAPWLGMSDADNNQQQERILYFGWIWDTTDFQDISIACKGDDAEVNLKLWAVGGDSDEMEHARGVLRKWLWGIWLQRICREGRRWYSEQSGDADDLETTREAIIDCITRCAGSDWWNWESGSRLFFWRWPKIWRIEARDGAPGFHYKYPRPRLRFPQVPLQEEWVVAKDREKLEKLLRRGYIGLGECRTTVPRFPVPKGDDDIRVVWDLSKNGLNDTMYTPTFFLATMSSYLRRIEAGFYGGDFDIGEQFHNYVLHSSEQPYCGVEIPDDLLKQLSLENVPVSKFMRWKRLVFGWQSSPYMALRMFARVLELAKGKPDDSNNAFAWVTVKLNLPGSEAYDPGRPRVMKMTAEGVLASDLVTFYDDGRVFGATEEAAHSALRQVTSRLQYYGNQEAARKRRPVSQKPGAWAGGVAYTDQNTLRKFISQEKWNKTKVFLDWVWERLQEEGGGMDRKTFLSGKGFLVHVSLCYDFMQPYMKGFHLSENMWRSDRDSEGWKVKPPSGFTDQDNDDESVESFWEHRSYEGLDASLLFQDVEQSPPPIVQAAPRLREDVRILRLFFQSEYPVQVIERPVCGTCFVAYGGGDASGEGFGGQVQPLGMNPLLRRGFWCATSSNESSNWRELRNIVDTIRMEVEHGRLVGREVWFATDNSTAVSAFYKGTSSSPLLHELVTDLRLLALKGNFILNLFHISGTRMIESGIDGLSRGELHVAALEKSIATIMPLHLTAIQRSPKLVNWLENWLDSDFRVAKPEHWFYEAHQAGEYDTTTVSKTWVWDLPPGAALHAIEELGMARLKRHDILRGVVLVPNLLSNEWFRRFTRTVDFYFTVPAGSIPEWPICANPGTGNEYRLWFHSVTRCQRCTRQVTHLQGIFCANFGQQVPGLIPCRSAWCGTCYRTLPGEDFLVYRPIDETGETLCAPGEEQDFLEGRPGDHLFCPFECDSCAFYRLKGRQPILGDQTDTRLLVYIRRANLDAFWSKRPGTVHGLTRLFQEQIEVGEYFGFNMFGPMGPFSRSYDSGMKAAVGILKRSQRPGNHEAKMKYSSVRKARSLHTDLYNATAQGVEGAMVWRSDRARFVASKASTDSAWFNAFMTGLKARIGERRKQDAAIPLSVMIVLQSSLEEDWEDAMLSGNEEKKRYIAEHGAFYLYLYCGSLRGFEGPKVVLSDLRRQVAPPGSPLAELYGAHIGLPLAGRFKARTQDSRNILIPIAYETASKLQPGVWTERLISVLDKSNIKTGWAFQDELGEQLRMAHFEEDFYERLTRIQQLQPDLFTDGVNILEDFHLARSFRRGATTRATAAGVSSADIDWINRWNIGADASGAGPMRVLYSDRIQLTKVFLRFSLAL